MESKLITVAIHTYEKALMLKSLLEREGVDATLQNVNLSQPSVASGVRVRIKESNLPLALRIIENVDIFCPAGTVSPADADKKPVILVPVDFSAISGKAVESACRLAARHNATLLLLHSFVEPIDDTGSYQQLSDSLTYEQEIGDATMRRALEDEANRLMNKLTADIRAKIKAGELPPVPFTTAVTEGLPEEVVIEQAKQCNPMLIVMGTRGADRKQRDLIGSVTAEVLDSCRYPVLTIPEESAYPASDEMQIVYFSNLDQQDILALDALYRLFPTVKATITLVHVPSRKQPADMTAPMQSLLDFCTRNYSGYTFRSSELSLHNVIDDYRKLADSQHIDLIAIPNKKRNVFARLFNPGIPHRLLFHSDVAMLSIPV